MTSVPVTSDANQTASSFLATVQKPCDFIIKVGDPVQFSFRVHRDVLIKQSDFFKNLCTLPFKESKEGSVTLPEADPTYVARMIIFFYMDRFDIRFKQFSWHSSCQEAIRSSSNFRAFCWSAEQLVSSARENAGFDLEDDDMIFAIKVAEDAKDTSEIALQMYALADQYDIQPMKSFVLKTMLFEWNGHPPENLIRSLKEIELADDMELMLAVVKVLHKHTRADIEAYQKYLLPLLEDSTELSLCLVGLVKDDYKKLLKDKDLEESDRRALKQFRGEDERAMTERHEPGECNSADWNGRAGSPPVSDNRIFALVRGRRARARRYSNFSNSSESAGDWTL